MRWKGRICGHSPKFGEPALSLIRREIAVQNPVDHPERVRNRRSSNGLEKRFLVAAEGFERMDDWPRGSEVGVRMPLHELKNLGERPFSRGDVSRERPSPRGLPYETRRSRGRVSRKSVRYRVPTRPSPLSAQRYCRSAAGARGSVATDAPIRLQPWLAGTAAEDRSEPTATASARDLGENVERQLDTVDVASIVSKSGDPLRDIDRYVKGEVGVRTSGVLGIL